MRLRDLVEREHVLRLAVPVHPPGLHHGHHHAPSRSRSRSRPSPERTVPWRDMAPATVTTHDDEHLAPAHALARNPHEQHRVVDAARAVLRPVLRGRRRPGGDAAAPRRGRGPRRRSAIVSYVLVFFAIWWAWMNFTWFASAYDNDDVVYRLLIARADRGRARSSPPASRARSTSATSTIVVLGYVVMRVGARSPHGCAPRASIRRPRTTALRYAVGDRRLQVAWVGLLGCCLSWPVWAFVVLVRRRARGAGVGRARGTTPWHPRPHRRALRPVHLHRARRVDTRRRDAIQAVVDEPQRRRRV